MKLHPHLGRLRLAVMVTVPVCALGSAGFMFAVGHRNNSRILLFLFTVWVLSPFVASAWVIVASKGWPAPAQAALYIAMLAVALGSVGIYGVAASGTLGLKPALPFLVVPLASWLILTTVVAFGALVAGKATKPVPPPDP